MYAVAGGIIGGYQRIIATPTPSRAGRSDVSRLGENPQSGHLVAIKRPLVPRGCASLLTACQTMRARQRGHRTKAHSPMNAGIATAKPDRRTHGPIGRLRSTHSSPDPRQARAASVCELDWQERWTGGSSAGVTRTMATGAPVNRWSTASAFSGEWLGTLDINSERCVISARREGLYRRLRICAGPINLGHFSTHGAQVRAQLTAVVNRVLTHEQ